MWCNLRWRLRTLYPFSFKLVHKITAGLGHKNKIWRAPQQSGHLSNQDTSAIRTPQQPGHPSNQYTSAIRTPQQSGHPSNQDTPTPQQSGNPSNQEPQQSGHPRNQDTTAIRTPQQSGHFESQVLIQSEVYCITVSPTYPSGFQGHLGAWGRG